MKQEPDMSHDREVWPDDLGQADIRGCNRAVCVGQLV